MLGKCVLETEGYCVTFELSRVESSNQLINALIEFRLAPLLPQISLQSGSNLMEVADLERLIGYFKAHTSALAQDPDTESYPFVTMELDFQLQALAGEVRTAEDGEFSIRFMVNVGCADEEASATYVGGESVVTLQNVNSFISSVEMTLNNLSPTIERA